MLVTQLRYNGGVLVEQPAYVNPEHIVTAERGQLTLDKVPIIGQPSEVDCTVLKFHGASPDNTLILQNILVKETPEEIDSKINLVVQ